MCDHEHAIHGMTGAEDEFTRLRERVAALEAALRVERAVGEAIAEGNTSVTAIATALRRRAEALMVYPYYKTAGQLGIFEHPSDVDRRHWFASELLALANEMERGEGK